MSHFASHIRPATGENEYMGGELQDLLLIIRTIVDRPAWHLEKVVEALADVESRRQVYVALARAALEDAEVTRLISDDQKKALAKLAKPKVSSKRHAQYMRISMVWRAEHILRLVLSTSISSRITVQQERYFQGASAANAIPLFTAGVDVLSDTPFAPTEAGNELLAQARDDCAALQTATESWRLANRPRDAKPVRLMNEEAKSARDLHLYRQATEDYLALVDEADKLWNEVEEACASLAPEQPQRAVKKRKVAAPEPVVQRSVPKQRRAAPFASSSRVLLEDLDAMEDVQVNNVPASKRIEVPRAEAILPRHSSPARDDGAPPGERATEITQRPKTSPSKASQAKPKPTRKSDAIDVQKNAKNDEHYFQDFFQKQPRTHVEVLSPGRRAPSPPASVSEQPILDAAPSAQSIIVSVIPPTSVAAPSDPPEPNVQSTGTETIESSGDRSGLGTTMELTSSQEAQLASQSPAIVTVMGAAQVGIVRPAEVRVLAPNSQEALDHDLGIIIDLKKMTPQRPPNQKHFRSPVLSDDVAYDAPVESELQLLRARARHFVAPSPGSTSMPNLPALEHPTFAPEVEVELVDLPLELHHGKRARYEPPTIDYDFLEPDINEDEPEGAETVTYAPLHRNFLAAAARPEAPDDRARIIRKAIDQSVTQWRAAHPLPSPVAQVVSPPAPAYSPVRLPMDTPTRLPTYVDVNIPLPELEQDSRLIALADRLFSPEATISPLVGAAQEELATVDPHEVLSQGERPALDEDDESSDDAEEDTTAYAMPPAGQERVQVYPATSSADAFAPSRQPVYATIMRGRDAYSDSSSTDLAHVMPNNILPIEYAQLETPLVSSQERFFSNDHLSLSQLAMDRASSQASSREDEVNDAVQSFLQDERMY